MKQFAAPKKRLGQHFLHDRSVVERMVQAFRPITTDRVVEIGPGRGVLTQALAQRVEHFDVVELDRDLAHWLAHDAEFRTQLRVHQCDVLKFDFTQLLTETVPLRVIGNLPYQISSPLLFKLLALGPRIQDMCFMLQKEFVDRLLASPGSRNYGRLTVMAGRYCTSQRLFNVAPGAFTPPPKVDSAIIHMTPRPREVLDEQPFADIVRHAFSARRKTLRNGLKEMASVEVIEAAGIDPGVRPQEVTIEEFERLASLVKSSTSSTTQG